MANPLDAGSLAKADDVLAKLPGALAQLEEADAAARRVSVDLRESEDKEAANQTVAATSARTALIESGRQIVGQAQRADEAARAVREAWQGVVDADALARDAAALVTYTTAEHVTASKDKTNAAAAAFADAQAALEELAATYDDVDLAGPLDYVAKRIEAMGYALASDDAFLAKNKEEAVSPERCLQPCGCRGRDAGRRPSRRCGAAGFRCLRSGNRHAFRDVFNGSFTSWSSGCVSS